jgi:hypothetical protein
MNRPLRLTTLTVALAFATVLSAPSIATAGVILSPVTALASDTLDGNINHTIDQTGLSAAFVSGVTDFDAYIASNPTHDGPGAANAWAGNAGALPINLDYNLGATYDVDTLALWTSFSGFSINRFQVFTADNAGFVGATNVGGFDANDTLPPMVAQIFDLLNTNAQYLRVQILSNEGAGAVNLSELAVEVTPVPEPLTLTLFGTGVLATVVRLRRKNHA